MGGGEGIAGSPTSAAFALGTSEAGASSSAIRPSLFSRTASQKSFLASPSFPLKSCFLRTHMNSLYSVGSSMLIISSLMTRIFSSACPYMLSPVLLVICSWIIAASCFTAREKTLSSSPVATICLNSAMALLLVIFCRFSDPRMESTSKPDIGLICSRRCLPLTFGGTEWSVRKSDVGVISQTYLS